MKKRRIPWFWRRRESCPDCGWSNEYEIEIMLYRTKIFTCPRCHAIYSESDFAKEQEEKWSLKMKETE